jgi:hypothetical protein
MKLYLTDERTCASVYRRLKRISTDVEQLKYFRGIEVPKKVKRAACEVQDFCDETIADCLKKAELFGEFSYDDLLSEVFEKSPELRRYLGSLCVFCGEESEIVIKELQRIGAFPKIIEALNTGKSLLIVID